MQIYAGGLGGCSSSSCHFSLFEWPSLALLSPHVDPDENHDWSSVGILKGPQLGVRWSACSSPTLHAGLSLGVLNPSSVWLSLNAAAGLALPGDTHRMQKRSGGGGKGGNEKSVERAGCVNTSACVREADWESGDHDKGVNEGSKYSTIVLICNHFNKAVSYLDFDLLIYVLN